MFGKLFSGLFGHTLLILALFSASPACWVSAHENETASPERLVKGLALQNQDIAKELELLQRQPARSCALLVAELHPIPRKTYYPEHKTSESRHIIACLRALRYLTGLTFSAATSAKLSDDEKQFLDFKKQMRDSNPTHKIHFFSVWMSRDADLAAPEDAQKEIIKEWQKWNRHQSAEFSYRHFGNPAAEMENWYWYG